MTVIAPTTTPRRFGYCNAGLRKWFPRDGVSFDDFRQHGVTTEWLRATGDAMACPWPMPSNNVRATQETRKWAAAAKAVAARQSYVVGHRYYAGLHLAICHGPVDAVTRIIVGERTAWSGSITSSQTIYVNAPELFGGDSREGGVQGYVEVKMGGPAETVSGYLQQKLGSVIPAFRGVVSIIAQQCQLSAMNPYIKPWSIEARRIPAPAALGSGYINGDANPAHIIYECLNNATWGLGYATSEIDASSFQTAAYTLAAEQYGLSLLWDREQPLEEFIAESAAPHRWHALRPSAYRQVHPEARPGGLQRLQPHGAGCHEYPREWKASRVRPNPN
jgi:hypothetical protein